MSNPFTNGPWTFSDAYSKLTIKGCEGCWPVLEIPQRSYGDTEAVAARLKADVRLMAAAPELLKELEQLADCLLKICPRDRGDGIPVLTLNFFPEFQERVESLIKKARGSE